MVTEVARSVIDQARANLPTGDMPDLVSQACAHLDALARSRLQTVVNATGVILHTNLGRAPLAPEAARAAQEVGVSYTNLELDLETGSRGRRSGFLLHLLAELTGAEAALVVNNNAGALVLALAGLAGGKGVLVSRGELIEIGGAYRLPEIIGAGGASLVEVGTTNRTRLADYRNAITDSAAVLLRVHPSNYRIVGFTEQADLSSLLGLAREHGLVSIFDVGSGLLDERVPWLPGAPPRWLEGEPGVRQAVQAGTDLVLFSGDKLFGGPQAGIIVGRSALIARLSRHPLARALRVDGSTVAALTATAEMYADGRAAQVPVWSIAMADYAELEGRARRVLTESGIDGHIEPSDSVVGAGSVPGAVLPSPVIVVGGSADSAYRALLRGEPPVLARREGGRLLLDLRAVPKEFDGTLARALAAACRS
jgi:L-seryl-tRNA(Ser) seleniumtransferase